MGNKAPLALFQVAAGYGRSRVIQDLDLHVEAQEIAVVIGPNGAGKTTLASTLSGILPLMSGRIDWSGADIGRWSAARRVAAGISLVPQGAPSFPHLNIIQNVSVASSAVQRDRSSQRRSDDALGLFPELGQRTHQMAGTLSGGQRQMLAIARAISQEPELLIIDEPSFGLAVGVRQRVVDALHNLREKRDTTMVVVEQDLNMVRQLADSVYYMASGRLSAMDTDWDIPGPSKKKQTQPVWQSKTS